MSETETKYNYVVVFKGQLCEGVNKFMTEGMAKEFMLSIIKNARLNDLIISVKRVTPEPMIWDTSTASVGDMTFTPTGTSFTLD